MRNLKDWAEIPKRFKFRATDADGKRHYFTTKPSAWGHGCWESPSMKAQKWYGGEHGERVALWRFTLEIRPKQ